MVMSKGQEGVLKGSYHGSAVRQAAYGGEMKLFNAVVGLRCQGTSYIIRSGQSFSCSDQTLFRPMNISNPQARGVYLPFTTTPT
jgi:hypothetical protein